MKRKRTNISLEENVLTLEDQDLSAESINFALEQEQVVLNSIGELCRKNLLKDLVSIVLDYWCEEMPKKILKHNGYWCEVRPRVAAWKAFYYPTEEFVSLRKFLLDLEPHFSDKDGCYVFKNLAPWRLFILRDKVGFMYDCGGMGGAFVYNYVMIPIDGTKFLVQQVREGLLSRHATLKDAFDSIS